MFFKKPTINPSQNPASSPEAAPPAAAAPPAGFMPQTAAPASGAPAATAQPAPLSAEEIKKRGLMAKQVAASFGEIVTLMMRSSTDRALSLQDLEWMVVPALQTGQFAVAEAQSKETGAVMPVGAVLWAFVSAEIDQKLSSATDQPIRLQPADWRSGPNPWIVMAIGDSKVLGGLLQQLGRTVFAKQAPKMRTRGTDGNVVVGRLEFSAVTPS
jgi:hemolysin-activating ACP:hemolysin acyltransferase